MDGTEGVHRDRQVVTGFTSGILGFCTFAGTALLLLYLCSDEVVEAVHVPKILGQYDSLTTAALARVAHTEQSAAAGRLHLHGTHLSK